MGYFVPWRGEASHFMPRQLPIPMPAALFDASQGVRGKAQPPMIASSSQRHAKTRQAPFTADAFVSKRRLTHRRTTAMLSSAGSIPFPGTGLAPSVCLKAWRKKRTSPSAVVSPGVKTWQRGSCPGLPGSKLWVRALNDCEKGCQFLLAGRYSGGQGGWRDVLTAPPPVDDRLPRSS